MNVEVFPAVWLISDTHFGHRNIVAYEGRPADHEERMWSSLSRLVGKSDLLVHVGDVALGIRSDVDAVAVRLPGVKILVEGNHDVRSRVRRAPGWLSVTRYRKTLALQSEGLNVAVSHRRQDLDISGAHVAVHGHSHGKGSHVSWLGGLMIVNACVEHWGYSPINLADILRIYRAAPNEHR